MDDFDPYEYVNHLRSQGLDAVDRQDLIAALITSLGRDLEPWEIADQVISQAGEKTAAKLAIAFVKDLEPELKVDVLNESYDPEDFVAYYNSPDMEGALVELVSALGYVLYDEDEG